MGWLVYSESKTEAEAIAELRRLHDWTDGDGKRYRVLADGITGTGEDRAYYAAVSEEVGGQVQRVGAAVCLCTLAPFGYKGMHEDCGPYVSRAPLEVLQALTPLPPPTDLKPAWACDGSGTMTGPRWHESAQGKPCDVCEGAGETDRYSSARRWRRAAWQRHGGEPQGVQLELISA